MGIDDRSPPAIDNLGGSVLDPPETFPERPFHLAFNSINLVASNPFLPLQLRVIKAPGFGRRPKGAFAFLHLNLFAKLIWLNRISIISTVTPQVLHVARPSSFTSIVTLHLHPPIPG